MENKLKIPNHIAIILDGNRRYAIKKGVPKIKGHEYGARNVRKLFEWCREIGIRELTLYVFSTENFNRSKDEIDYLMFLLKSYFKRMDIEKLREKGICISIIGDIKSFPKDIQKVFHKVRKETKNNNKLIVNFALGYGSRAEITEAVKNIIKDVRNKKIDENDINERTVTQNLYLSSEPDILIRPGGEKRLSNFLLWQLSYSELFFIDKLWPEFTKEDLMEIIKEYNQRERRFGK